LGSALQMQRSIQAGCALTACVSAASPISGSAFQLQSADSIVRAWAYWPRGSRGLSRATGAHAACLLTVLGRSFRSSLRAGVHVELIRASSDGSTAVVRVAGRRGVSRGVSRATKSREVEPRWGRESWWSSEACRAAFHVQRNHEERTRVGVVRVGGGPRRVEQRFTCNEITKSGPALGS